MRQALQRAWLRRGPLAMLLWPFSLPYRALAAVRPLLVRLGLVTPYRAPVPVVVVGNVVAGGAGKTPVVIALVQHLAGRGLPAGVVSRGYGRRSRGCRAVVADSDPGETGDEPLLIARRTGAPVVVAERRAEAIAALLQAHPHVRVIVSDDGLQHAAMARDVEICVFDERGTGNGWLLPAGPLREPWPRRADLVLRPVAAAAIAGHGFIRRLAAAGHQADGTRVPLATLEARPCTALAAIAQPDRFFGMLRDRGIVLADTVALPDHAPMDTLPPGIDPGRPLLCTEKDAAKLWRHRPDAIAVPLDVALDAGFWPAFDALLYARLSSSDGPQTP